MERDIENVNTDEVCNDSSESPIYERRFEDNFKIHATVEIILTITVGVIVFLLNSVLVDCTLTLLDFDIRICPYLPLLLTLILSSWIFRYVFYECRDIINNRIRFE